MRSSPRLTVDASQGTLDAFIRTKLPTVREPRLMLRHPKPHQAS